MPERLVAEIVSNFHGSEIDFCIFQEMLKTRKDCVKLAPRRGDGNSKSAGVMGVFIDVENCREFRRPELYKDDVLLVIRQKQLMGGLGKYIFVFVNGEAKVETELDFILYTSFSLKKV